MPTDRPRKPVIRLLSIASSCKTTLSSLGCDGTNELIALVQQAVGDSYRVAASAAQIEVNEDDCHAGRRDDTARAREIERTLADNCVAAAVALRGGAWLTRILPRIDFDVLKRRRKPIALFGFSELSPLLNIAAQYDKVVAYHDLCPAYLLQGMTDYARRNVATLHDGSDLDQNGVLAFARGWAAGNFRAKFEAFFKDAVAMIEGRASARVITGRWINTKPKHTNPITVVGGNLTTIVTLTGTPYADALRPDGKWLLIEDVRETPDRVDRLLCHLSLSGWLQRYQGILLGQFHDRGSDCTQAVLECVEQHLGRARRPIVITTDVGHTWPISPVPLGRQFAWRTTRVRKHDALVTAQMPWAAWRI